MINVFVMRGTIPFSIHRSHIARPYYSLHGQYGSSLKIDFYWYMLCAHFPHDPLSVQGLQTDRYVETPLNLLGVDSHPSVVDLYLPGVDLLFPS